ncbi:MULTISPECIES: OmpA family protein [Flavobacterium]|uniref:OmpA-like domain-containing protein n=1 Tax=Flavobacterium hankyongi TaxID=1176532 RepID=A0ABP8ZVM3_9FLAO|nr:OmpA family protein [Flavobacterium sp. N1846]
MSKTTPYLLGIITTIVIGCFLYHHFCCKKCNNPPQTKNKIVSTKSEEITNNKFQFSDENINHSCEKNFNFNESEFNYITPADDCLNIGIEKLKNYFTNNKEARLIITGYASTSEKNTSAFPNLGFARANDIKNYFVSKGIPSNRFEINGEIKEGLQMVENKVLGPINFVINKTQALTKAENWNGIKEKYTETPLILFFDSNQTEISLTDAERESIAEIAKYIDNVPNSKISCVGHTDNSGNRLVNINLGLERANFVKNYLIKNGMLESKIETSSKGPDEPIADNLTPEGKGKNRRTVITLK